MTSTWRYIGSLAGFDTERKQGKSREEIQARGIEGWTPWLPLENWQRVLEPGIVAPPAIPPDISISTPLWPAIVAQLSASPIIWRTTAPITFGFRPGPQSRARSQRLILLLKDIGNCRTNRTMIVLGQRPILAGASDQRSSTLWGA
jgi:hypothetical protein